MEVLPENLDEFRSFLGLFPYPTTEVFRYGTCITIYFAINVCNHITHVTNIWLART
jgi:hypothetical protein